MTASAPICRRKGGLAGRALPEQLGAPLQDLEQRRFVVGLAIKPLERDQRVAVVGRTLQDLAVPLGGQDIVGQLLGPAGQGAGYPQPDAVVEDVALDQTIQLHHPLGAVPGGVAQPFVRVEQLAELGLTQSVQNGRGVGIERSRRLAQPLLLETTQPNPMVHPRARIVVAGDVELDQAGQLRPLGAPLVDGLEHLRRDQAERVVPAGQVRLHPLEGERIGGLQVQHLVPAIERVLRPAEGPFQQLGHAAQDLHARPHPGGELQASLQDLEAFRDRPLALVEGRQHLQGGDVVRVFVEDGQGRRDGLVDVPQLRLQDDRHAESDVAPSLRIGRELEPPAHDIDPLALLSEPLVEPLELAQGDGVRLVGLQERPVGGHRRRQIAERLLLDLRHPPQDFRPLGVVGGPVRLHAQDVHEARGTPRPARRESRARPPPAAPCPRWTESSSRMRRQVRMAASRSPSNETCSLAARVRSSTAAPRWLPAFFPASSS